MTLGFTWKTSAQSEWTGYAAHAFSKTVSGQNSIPASLLGGGEADASGAAGDHGHAAGEVKVLAHDSWMIRCCSMDASTASMTR